MSLSDGEGRIVAETFTDDDGRYEFTDLPEGHYTLLAVGYPPAADGVVLDAGQAVEHEITLGARSGDERAARAGLTGSGDD